ncbi:MAG: hypothetical protein O7F73_16600 [Gammaproteobacteria bacterium]|nr:hypothetical protein [Gammaproteobacteria bacterium]
MRKPLAFSPEPADNAWQQQTPQSREDSSSDGADAFLTPDPSIIAALTDFVFGDDQSLRYSLALLPAIVCPLAAVLIARGLPHYRAALASLENRQ